ncbi:ABC transporter permease [Vibrio rhizosphaerae]|uniref:ABC transporter permease n=1 Tax=Vibrio rhizosphaerae TaxID=398736 RepID=UPI00056E29B1|nr:ABC transporter permease [Vibrio rhizosphaerae]
MSNLFCSFYKPFSILINHRYIIQSLTKKDIISRYRGSILGIMWSFFNPLLMLGLYTFFFRFVFKARWPNVGDSTADYAVMLFAGLVVHALASDIISKSSGIISRNSNLVKKVVFPIEVLPWVVLMSSLFHMLISMLVLIGFFLISGGTIQWTILFLPVVFIPMAILFMGVSWFISALSAYIKDVEQLIGTVVTFLLFTSTVFFSIDNIPNQLKPLLYINPITQIINDFRRILVYGMSPDFKLLFIYTIAALIIFWGGYNFFMKVRKGFSDIL